MALTVLAIKLEEGLSAPVLYGQPRVGYAGRVFRVMKFRSMRQDAEKDGRARWAQANDDRVTRVGSFIRKVRIDELPQLFNVLAGRMSFVGPRPERPEFVKQLAETIPYYEVRHAVKPGITGWAQLCYPYGASEQDAMEKLQYDLYYVKNHSLVFDILILSADRRSHSVGQRRPLILAKKDGGPDGRRFSFQWSRSADGGSDSAGQGRPLRSTQQKTAA